METPYMTHQINNHNINRSLSFNDVDVLLNSNVSSLVANVPSGILPDTVLSSHMISRSMRGMIEITNLQSLNFEITKAILDLPRCSLRVVKTAEALSPQSDYALFRTFADSGAGHSAALQFTDVIRGSGLSQDSRSYRLSYMFVMRSFVRFGKMFYPTEFKQLMDSILSHLTDQAIFEPHLKFTNTILYFYPVSSTGTSANEVLRHFHTFHHEISVGRPGAYDYAFGLYDLNVNHYLSGEMANLVNLSFTPISSAIMPALAIGSAVIIYRSYSRSLIPIYAIPFMSAYDPSLGHQIWDVIRKWIRKQIID